MSGSVPMWCPQRPPSRDLVNNEATSVGACWSSKADCSARPASWVNCRARAGSSRMDDSFNPSRCRSKCGHRPLDFSSSDRKQSKLRGVFTKARNTSRQMTLPDPSQIPFSGASRYSRGRFDSSTYPAPPKHSIASPTTGTMRLLFQNLPIATANRAKRAASSSWSVHQTPVRHEC